MDLILFGAGWSGEHREINREDIVEERAERFYKYIPHIREPKLREARFKVKEYYCESDGEIYMIGFSGPEPLMPDVEEAILINRPRPF